MKLIVGLGNPGKEYERTRHNAGFRAVRAFHTLHIEEFDGWKRKFNGEIAEGRIAGDKVALLLPQTYMNESGTSVAEAAGFWHVEPKDVVIVYDELDIPVGSLRIRADGSAGGHNGMKSVLARLGTMDVPRFRIGIKGEHAAGVPSEDYVLGKFTADEETLLGQAIGKTVEALDVLLNEGIEAAMNRYN
jgi:PTH1 family peptidyl-tRNA hydrolase